MRDKKTWDGIEKDAAAECEHTIHSPVDATGGCVSCGADLKGIAPGPGDDVNVVDPGLYHLATQEHKVEIDRLTAELEAKDKKRVEEQNARIEAENECCVLRGEIDRLTAELAVARKKPEPGEFTKGQWEWLKGFQRHDYWMPRFTECLEEIDHLTAELVCEECEKSLEDPETGVTAFCMACWNAMITKLRAEIEAKDAALEKLARLGNEPYLGNSEGNIIAQQALKEKP